jgi:hypothetical protein
VGDQWLWEFVARYSGATVPGFHGVPRHLIAIQGEQRVRHFKERSFLNPVPKNCQVKSGGEIFWHDLNAVLGIPPSGGGRRSPIAA